MGGGGIFEPRCGPLRTNLLDGFTSNQEITIMDAHFNEYLAAVAGMQEIYGDSEDGRPVDFHDDTAAATVAVTESAVPVGSTWDA
jgi:hypothetical protein